jgi:predicted acetyltransferase
MPAREANAIMEADGWRLLLDWDQTTEWRSWLKTIDEHRRGLSLSVGLVPSVQLVADVDGVIVGSVRVRFSLNKGLERSGGHIGYGVVPAYRRRGYATEMLRQALIIARSHGIQRVLVTCLDDNVGSARVIEKCGGVLDEIIDIDEGNLRLRRYSFA